MVWNHKRKRKREDGKQREQKPESGWWKGCDGEVYAEHAKCRKCGKTRANHLPPGIQATEPKRNPVLSLDTAFPNGKSLLRIDGQVRIRITRGYRGTPLDYDNLAGGLKKLRDQITEKILGRNDDSEASGITWEYRQEKGAGVLIEIFTKE